MMGGLARVDRAALDSFNRFWEGLYQAFPEARRVAVAAMGQEVQRDLYANISGAALRGSAKIHVMSWQDLIVGSGGGYAALRPQKGPPTGGTRSTTWKGAGTTAKQVTRWLERGHGIKRGAGSEKRWNRAAKTGIRQASMSYVEGRMFYSWTKLRAVEHALAAAEKVLEKIDEGVEW